MSFGDKFKERFCRGGSGKTVEYLQRFIIIIFLVCFARII